MRNLIDMLWDEWKLVELQIEKLNLELERISATDAGCTRIRQIPGVGPVVATAIVAAIGNGAAFRKGRDFAAWLGIVPRQHSTGGKPALRNLPVALFRYPGGKVRYSKWILPNLFRCSGFSLYVEPFVGGGSVALAVATVELKALADRISSTHPTVEVSRWARGKHPESLIFIAVLNFCDLGLLRTVLESAPWRSPDRVQVLTRAGEALRFEFAPCEFPLPALPESG